MPLNQQTYMYIGIAVGVLVLVWWWKQHSKPETFVPASVDQIRKQYPGCQIAACANVINSRRAKGMYYDSKDIPQCQGCPRVTYGDYMPGGTGDGSLM